MPLRPSFAPAARPLLLCCRPASRKGFTPHDLDRSLCLALLTVGCAAFSRAAEVPSDPCALLTPETISKTLKHTYGAPEKQTAPRPFPNTNEGTDCIYGGSRGVIFRIYVDPSPSASADLFAKLKSFFGTGSTAVSGVGDEAYLDKNKGLHVRKGKVRYFIDGTGSPEQKNELAKAVAAQL